MQIKTPEANTDNDLLLAAEVGGIRKMWKDMKESIFGVMFILLKENEMSIYLTVILCVIEFLQVISLAFHDEFATVWGSPDIFKVVRDVLGYTRLLPYLDSTNMSAYSAVLYILIALIIVILADCWYVNYIHTRQKSSFAWPIFLLKVLVMLTTTILCLPVFEYCLSFLACVRDYSGTLVHFIFTEQKCGEGIMLGNMVVGAIGALVMAYLTFVFTLTLFEGRNIPSNPISRVSSRANLLFTAYKFEMVILLNFLIGSQYQVILIICFMASSIMVFYLLQFDNPYYNYVMAKTWSTCAALNLWTATMLVFAKIMQGTAFTEAIITWLLGLPLVFFLTIFTNDKRMDFLLINVNQFEQGKEIINQVTYLLKLLDTQETSHNSAVLLDGYLEVHKQDCAEAECPLKRRNKVLHNNKIIRNLLSSDPNIKEKEAIIVYLVYQIYIQGLKKFSDNTTLRIAYAFFLLDKMHSKQQALQELSDVEQRNPPLDEQFIIYRYKKMIEDDIAEAQQNEQKGGGLDVVNEMSFQNLLRMCQAYIEGAALLHLEFWSQLSEDQPDLAKLADIGNKITISIKGVESQYEKLMKINPGNTKAMRLFGEFLIEIVHDRERGEEILEKARNLTNIKNNSKKNANFIPVDEAADEGTPIIVISGEQDRFALITNINLAAASLFGFSKTELMNRKINTLMPPIYAKYHDGFIEKYLATMESSIIGKNKERLTFGKNKANYIFPFHYNLKAIPSIMLGIQFVSTIRVEKNLKNTAYVLTNSEGVIDSISSSCITLLKFDIKYIIQKKIKIQDCIPNVISDRQTIFAATSNNSKIHAQVEFTFLKGSEYVEGNETSATLNCYLNELMPSNDGKDGAGFQFRFERINEKAQNLHYQDVQISNFQFKYARHKPNIIGEFTTKGIDSEFVDLNPEPSTAQREEGEEGEYERSELNRSNIEMHLQMKKNREEEEEKEYERKNFGIGVKTYQLRHGMVGELDEEKSEEESKSEDTNQGKKGSVFQNLSTVDDDLDEGSLADFGNADKFKKVLTSVITDKSPPKNLQIMKWVMYGVGLILVALSTFDYINIVKKANQISSNVDNLDISHQMIANMMIMLSGVRDLYLVQKGVYPSTQEPILKQKIKDALVAAKGHKEDLELTTSSLPSGHLALFNSPVISLYAKSGSTTRMGLIQATEDMITKGLNIAGTTLSQITPDNADYYFVTRNLFNDYYSAMVRSSEFYAQELIERKKTDTTSFIIVLVLSIIVLIISMAVMIPVLYSITKARDHILGLFFDIPSKTVKSLYMKCENFVSNLQLGEDDDNNSEMEDDGLDKVAGQDSDASEWAPRSRKRKKFKNTGRNYRFFFFLYLIVVAAVEVIFIYNFTSSNNLLSNVDSIATEFNSTSYAEFFYAFSDNSERQLFIDSTLDILGKSALTIVGNNIQLMQDLDSQILSENSLNIGSHTSTYNGVFQQIVYGDSCPLLTSYVTSTVCEAFADKTITKGMTVAIVRHFENMRTLLQGYDDIVNDNTWPFSTSEIDPPVDSNTAANRRYSLFILPQAEEAAIMQDIYIKYNYRSLVESFRVSLNEQFSSLKTVRLIIFIIFLLEITIIYLFIWNPAVSTLNTKLYKTRTMLRMIPLGVLVKIKNIRVFLRENHSHIY